MSRHVYSPPPLPEKIMPARPRLTLALRRQKSGLKVLNEGSLIVLLERRGVGQYLLFPETKTARVAIVASLPQVQHIVHHSIVT